MVSLLISLLKNYCCKNNSLPQQKGIYWCLTFNKDSNMKRIVVFGCLCTILATGCVKQNNQPGEVSGYVPIYIPEVQAKAIGFSAVARATVTAGKILVIGTRLYQVETGEGVHIIDIANPASPVKTGFITVPGCQELAAKGAELYVNNYNDLVVLNPPAGILPLLNITKRVTNAFPASLNSIPPSTGYFECPDPAKGYVTGWTRTTVKNPKCRR
jgi:hypothetical protein